MAATFIRGLLGATLLAALALPAAPASAQPWNEVTLQPQQISAAGTQIAWASIGVGPPLLLLNGTASPMNEWDPAFLGALAEEHRVIVIDYPGLGRSGPSPADWTFPHAADWIADFLQQVEPDRAVDVLGWSMGGFIAQRLAIQHPTQVNRLILAATNPGGDSAVLGPRWVQEADSSGSDDAYLTTNYPVGGRQAGQRFIDRLEAAIDAGRYPEESVPARTRRAMVAAEDPWLRSNANRIELGGITAPALVITGRDDVITPPANSRRIARAIPGSRLLLVAGSGHSFLFQRPVRMARVVNDFLR